MAKQPLTLSQIAAHVLRHPRPAISVIAEAWLFPAQYEIQLIEATEMARRNGIVVAYTPQLEESNLIWHRIVLKGDKQIVAWLIVELEAIAQGLRG